MKQILGILKFGAAFIIFLGLIISIIDLKMKDDMLVTVLTVLIAIIVFGCFIYYLVQTGIWNFKNRTYTINIFLLFGLFFHFIFTFSALYYGSQFTKELLFTTIPFAVLGLAIGTFDLIKFYWTWRNKSFNQASSSNISHR